MTGAVPTDGMLNLVRALYPDPDPLRSIEHYHRSIHEDLADLTDEGLDAERMLAGLRWSADLVHRQPISDWLIERRSRLEAEHRRRRNGR